METPASRLKAARKHAGHVSAKAAAEAMSIPASTYIQHESGLRPFPERRARLYGEAFGVTAQWLLFGGADTVEAADPPPIDPASLEQVTMVPVVGWLTQDLVAKPRKKPNPAIRVPVIIPRDIKRTASLSAYISDQEFNFETFRVQPDDLVIVAATEDVGICDEDYVLVRHSSSKSPWEGFTVMLAQDTTSLVLGDDDRRRFENTFAVLESLDTDEYLGLMEVSPSTKALRAEAEAKAERYQDTETDWVFTSVVGVVIMAVHRFARPAHVVTLLPPVEEGRSGRRIGAIYHWPAPSKPEA